jgi:hypothetical protein
MKLVDVDELNLQKQDRTKYVIPEYADGWNALLEKIESAPVVNQFFIPKPPEEN